MKKVIILKVSKPDNASRKQLLGQTEFDADGLNTVWIREGQEGKQLVDTYFHEMTHVFIGLSKHKKLSNKEEEQLCRMVGQCAASILTRGSTR